MPDASRDTAPVTIPPSDKQHSPLALGCWQFGGSQWGGQDEKDSLAVMRAAVERGIVHFDTATGYGQGRSEQLVGQFLKDNNLRDKVFLASKQGTLGEDAEGYYAAITASLERVQSDYLDLYYIHWPKTGVDLRPTMRALERARGEGKIRTIGVSNFSVEQMKQVAEAGPINAHQIGYSLLWRWDEQEVIPYCQENGIAVVTYSSIAQGILTGKFGPERPTFREGDSRGNMVLFDEQNWPIVYEGVERMEKVADRVGRPLTHLAIRWCVNRPFVRSVLVGARNADQLRDDAAAMEGEIPQSVFDELTGISDEVMSKLPNTGNIFRYYP